MRALDYSALEQPSPSVGWKEALNQQLYSGYAAFAAIFGIALVMSGFMMVIRQDFSIAVINLLFGLGVIAVPLWRAKKQAAHNAQLLLFAAANGIEFLSRQKAPMYAGIFFQAGHSREIQAALRIPEVGEVGNYHYETGSGKNRATHEIGYIRFTLTRRVPHMLLDAKANNVFGLSNMPFALEKSQKLELEGDFGTYFTLYAPKGYERDALYIWTPDVMASAVDEAAVWDVECVDDEVYMYSSSTFHLADPAALRSMLGRIERLQHQLEAQADYYKDAAVPSRAANIVAQGGARLKTKRPWVVAAIFASLVAVQFFATFVAPLTADPIKGVQAGAFTFIIASSLLPILLLVIVFLKLRRKKK
ncbi:hypothetical protein JNM87_01515 [Candidatus Saccharibacteria bacterium]|nr:hypothetical protein [Candidatus Saccharibacteria bacterium]